MVGVRGDLLAGHWLRVLLAGFLVEVLLGFRGFFLEGAVDQRRWTRRLFTESMFFRHADKFILRVDGWLQLEQLMRVQINTLVLSVRLLRELLLHVVGLVGGLCGFGAAAGVLDWALLRFVRFLALRILLV